MDNSNQNPKSKSQSKSRSRIVDYKMVPMSHKHVPCEHWNVRNKVRCKLCWYPLPHGSPDLGRMRGQRMTEHFCRWNIANDARPEGVARPMYRQAIWRKR